MADAPHEKLYTVLLDVQKQIGVVSRETGEQTKKLDALNEKVAVQNGRVTATEKVTAELREWRKYILGGFAVIGLLGSYLIYSFTENIINKASGRVISNLEKKYNLIIE